MIELFEQHERKNDIQSSNGNQLKWENDNYWYKADYTGYEGLSEYIISHLLAKSSLSDTEYVIYEPETIKYKTTIYQGVKSKNFLANGWQIITLERLFKSYFGESLYTAIYKITDHEQRMLFLVNQVERITGLNDFGKYLNKLLTIDALFLNEDRHTHNIAVLMHENGKFDYCPIFDNGAGLLADTKMDYPLREDIYKLMSSVKAKTICSNFDAQLDISEKLYKRNISFTFNKRDVQELLNDVSIYSSEEKNRVKEIIYLQMDKYRYLFENNY